MIPTAPRRSSFPPSRRLHGRRAFARVFAAGMKKHAPPVTVFSCVNELAYCRLGLSVSRRVAKTNVTRNRIKRLLREAFRLDQHDLPAGYDLVVVARPHDPLPLEEYRKCLAKATRALHLEWERRRRR